MYMEVYITAGSMEEAREIGSTLVSEKLVACVNMFPISSIYEWKGNVEEDEETAMLVKTTSDRFEKIKKRVQELHSYDQPCIVTWDISGETGYMKWVYDETHK
ncbi:divalent-cation tolerance protein CutA [Methanohalobium sp.]|uniref:divalent-cation tolerance protein CutA n=1 Tax=Methanohalobium sp. TaxID=2837493 RepID=UPI0025F03A87|nr:divalent-cation tolerance protein CutA [Methanohalobium sp.]